MRQDRALRLMETVAARLCHDFAGAAGGIAAALAEAASQDAAADTGDARALAGALQRRLVLLRAAWGPVCDGVGRDGLMDLLEGLPRRDRLRLDIRAPAPPDTLTAPYARAALNLLLLGAEALRFGGTLTLTDGAAFGPDAVLACDVDGPGARWPDPPDSGLVAAERTLQATFLRLSAEDAGLRPVFAAGPAATLPALVLRRFG